MGGIAGDYGKNIHIYIKCICMYGDGKQFCSKIEPLALLFAFLAVLSSYHFLLTST